MIDRWLLRALILLAAAWLIHHWNPPPLIQLITPTQTVTRQYAGLPPVDQMESPRR